MSMLEEMRKRVKDRQPSFEKDNSVFPFWNLNYGNSCTLRFLPYNDQFTGAFWAERILLPMAFTAPDDSSKVWTFKAPCREMYDRGEKCPVLAPVRALYGEEKEMRNTGQSTDADRLKKIAGFHWKKPTYYYQGFVIKAGMSEDEIPENPIRVFPLNKKLHGKVFNSIFENEEDPFEKLPTGEFTMEHVTMLFDGAEVDPDIFEGRNFIIKNIQQGEYSDWTTGSQWQTKASSLDDEQLTALAKYGLHDLTKRLPDRPSDEQYEVLVEMMQVSIERMLHGENGVWRPEWEEAGFKPIKPRGSSDSKDGDDTSSKPSTKTATKATGGASEALAKLRASRGKTAEPEPTDDDTAASEESTDSDAKAETSSASNVQALADKIRNRVNKSA